jgi:CMP-N-acetylneuraminic acid synthetase
LAVAKRGPRVVCIIPVRGGSKGIPRKNARLLAGRPLLSYSVTAAQRSRRISELYVSTDSVELAEIARSLGAVVLERPSELAADSTTIDEVILHEVVALEAASGPVDVVVTIQATSPLLSPHTIDTAVDLCTSTGCDTVLSVAEDTHLRWTRSPEGIWSPLYEKRVNRQQLAPTYRETGGVVVCARRTLGGGSRFGSDVRVVEVPPQEAVDIDSRFEWWTAEKSLSRRKVLFHVAGNAAIGTGHVHRALSLADRMIDHEVGFLVNEESPLALEMIRARHYPVRCVPAGGEVAALLEEAPDLLVNDILDTSAELMRPLAVAGIRTANFEDLGPGSELADCVINEMYDHHPIRGKAGTHNGVDVVCLRDEFYFSPPVAPRETVGEVLLVFGGTDPSDLMLRVFPWVDSLPGEWRITVLTGIGYSRSKDLAALLEGANHPVTVLGHAPVVSRIFERADLAVTSAGRTVFELASKGVPMVVLCQNEREMTHSFAKGSDGVAWLGLGREVERERFQGVVSEIVGSALLRGKMRDSLLRTDIRGGIERVIRLLEGILETDGGRGT